VRWEGVRVKAHSGGGRNRRGGGREWDKATNASERLVGGGGEVGVRREGNRSKRGGEM